MKKQKNIFIWDDWFAWYPVNIDGRIIWLQTIQRQRAWFYPGSKIDGATLGWEYKLK